MHEIQMLGLLEHDVLSSIEVPHMAESKSAQPKGASETEESTSITKAEADKFDVDVFALTSNYNTAALNLPPNGTTPVPARPTAEKRASQRHSTIGRIDTIEESPKPKILKELPSEGLPTNEVIAASVTAPNASPTPSLRSIRSTSSKAPSRTGTQSKGSLASKLAPSWLFNPFRSGPSEPQTTQVSASASPTSHNEKLLKPPSIATTPSSPIRVPPSKPTVASTQPIQPVAIKNKTANRSSWSRTYEEETLAPHRSSFLRRSPINTPPRDDLLTGKRRSMTGSLPHSIPSSASPGVIINPTRPHPFVAYPEASLARRWQHVYPQPMYKHDHKWKSIVTPGCLPLTVEHFPSNAELESSYDMFSYEFIIDPSEMRSFLVKPPVVKGNTEEMRRAWALVVMRGMAAVRLAQGFQFILKPHKPQAEEERVNFRRTKSFMGEEETEHWPSGAAEVLSSTMNPVYLSMTNEIHRISYTGEAIQVKRYVRRTNPTRPFNYQCLIWPKLGGKIEFLKHLSLATD